MDLPDPSIAPIVRGIAAYMTSVNRSELPSALRPLRGKHHKMLLAYRRDIVSALEDETFRGLVMQWLGDKPTGIDRRDAAALSLIVERPPGWEAQLAAEFPSSAGKSTRPKDPEPAIQREKERARKAKDDAKRAREEAGHVVAEARREVSRLEEDLQVADQRAEDAERALAEARTELSALRGEMERELRKARKRAEAAEAALEKARSAVKARPKAPAPDEPRPKAKPKVPEPAPEEPAERVRLRAPRGRFEDAPETLASWLARPQVHLLVDGYNVSKSESGFGDVSLESQRHRLIQELERLARRHGIEATIVFDGSVVTPGTFRRPRGPVAVEYSRPDEIADDHLIAKLEALPRHPVVLVTNDKELQHRGARLGATIATSDQLLGLIR